MEKIRGKEHREKILQEKIRQHYEKNTILAVPKIEEREFGVGSFEKKIAKRHMYFSDEGKLNSYLKRAAPFYISYSTAYYKEPEKQPMDKKGFLGADIVYEFDSTDFVLKCRNKHDFYKCLDCGKTETGFAEKCIHCSSSRLLRYDFICPECLERVKIETYKLLDVLTNDFGISPRNFSLNYSGNRGYHIHLRDKEIFSLDENARLELLNYLALNDFDLSLGGFNFFDNRAPKPYEKSIAGKLVREAIIFLQNTKPEKLSEYTGVGLKRAKNILAKSFNLTKPLQEGRLPRIKEKDFWKNFFLSLKQDLSVNLDYQTSKDIKKLIRHPDTIHVGTMFLAKRFKNLDSFDPLTDAVAFRDREVKTEIKRMPRLFLLGNYYGPYKNKTINLPEALFLLLLSKDLVKSFEYF